MRPEEVELIRRDYAANGGWETFLEYGDPRQDILVGLLRLRRCAGADAERQPALRGAVSVVRELHVYGSAVAVHARDASKFQHQVGWGRLRLGAAGWQGCWAGRPGSRAGVRRAQTAGSGPALLSAGAATAAAAAAAGRAGCRATPPTHPACPPTHQQPMHPTGQGYGTLLMVEAERIARCEHRSAKLAVISGVGTRHYYRKLG